MLPLFASIANFTHSPFLAYVSNAATFDTQLTQYIGTTYAQQK